MGHFLKNFNISKKNLLIYYIKMNTSAGYGGMMIRNLRTPADYDKAVMTQDQLLKIAIANDSNIARARRDIRLGVPPPVPEANLKTAEELALDVGKQESDAMRNILDLGFTYDEASTIVSQLSQDQLFKLNMSFPSIKQQFSTKYDVRLVTPTFFVEFLKKFIEELDASKGVASAYGLGYVRDKFDELIDTTNELKAVIPTKNQILGLENAMKIRFAEVSTAITEPIIERLGMLEALLPDESLYARLDEIAKDDPSLAYKLNQELQNSIQGLPTRDQFEMLLNDIQSNRFTDSDKLKKVEDSVNNLSSLQTSQLASVRDLIEGVRTEMRQAGIIEGQLEYAGVVEGQTFGVLAQSNQLVLVGGEGELIKVDAKEIKTINNEIQKETGVNPKLKVRAVKDKVMAISNPDLVSAINSSSYATAKSTGERALMGGVSDMTPSFREARDVFSPPRSSASSMTTREPVSKSGTGIAGKLKASKVKVKVPKMKIASGIADKKLPPYRQLGKYVIHNKQLQDNDILNVKYKSLGRIPQFKPIPVSDIFKEYLNDVLDSGKHNPRMYDNIPVEERKIWEKIVQGSGLSDTLKIKKTISDGEKDDLERFEMLKGQYIAGNNNPSVIRELRRFVVKFLSDGRLKRNQALDLLLELSV
jgi:hypothetical protein